MRDTLSLCSLAVLVTAAVIWSADIPECAAATLQGADPAQVDLEMPEPENAEQVAAVIERVEEDAVDVRHSAMRLLAFLESPGQYMWEIHAWRLQRIEERVSDLQTASRRLNGHADMLLEGQRAAFMVIRPAIEELDRLATEAVEHLNMARSGGQFEPRYRELTRAIQDQADAIVNAVRLAEPLSEVRSRLEGREQ